MAWLNGFWSYSKKYLCDSFILYNTPGVAGAVLHTIPGVMNLLTTMVFKCPQSVDATFLEVYLALAVSQSSLRICFGRIWQDSPQSN